MKHVLMNQDGQCHAVIMACPFKYTLPRGLSVHEDNPSMGKLSVDTYCHTQPKCKDEVDAHAIDFAVIKDGKVINVVQWGGAEWCPPVGATVSPLAPWMGMGDHYDHNDNFAIHEDRIGKSDKDKSVAELEADGL